MAKKKPNAPSDDIRWEDLMDVRAGIVKELVGNQAFLNGIVTGFKPQIESTPELKQVVIGVFNSLSDIAKTIFENTKLHVTLDENEKMVDYKKGVIDSNDLDYLDYNTIYNNYLMAGEQIVNIISFGYQEIVTTLNDKFNLVSKEEVESIRKVYDAEQAKLLKKTKGALNATFKTLKNHNKPAGRDRHQDLPRLPVNKRTSRGSRKGGDQGDNNNAGEASTATTATTDTATATTGSSETTNSAS